MRTLSDVGIDSPSGAILPHGRQVVAGWRVAPVRWSGVGLAEFGCMLRFERLREGTTMTKATDIVVIDEAELVCTCGPLEGEALERSRKARRQRFHLRDRQRYLDWKEGRPEDPEIARWRNT